MTDKSKLELLMKIVSLRPDGNHADLNDEYVEAYIEGQAEDILALCEPEWIPVDERLPITEEMMSGNSYMDKEVIICTRDNSVYTCLFEAGNTIDFWCGFRGYYEGYVTYWKPLPNPPEQSND